MTSPSLRPIHRPDPLELLDIRRLTSMLSPFDHGRRLHLEAPVHLHDDDTYAVHFLHLLQCAAGFGIRVDWTAASAPACDPHTISHLPPPTNPAPSSAPADVRRWQEKHHYGACHYRKGPGFYLLRDARNGAVSRLRITGDDRCRALEAHLRPFPPTGLPPDTAPMTSALHRRGLLLTIGTWHLAAPHRLRNWPVPYTTL
ncbi:DUF5825 family protein [Streptomyces sp. NPDC085614]|uniref:DUF5825 family protein n=1 Tax=Streptomyces sp. NPDC085614 TaxID=3365733 RepID=UPI0037D8D443